MVLRKAETAAALRFLERGCEWETLAFGERRPDGGRLRMAIILGGARTR